MEKSRHGAFVYAQKVLKHSLFLFLLINLLSISPDISASTTLLEQKYTLNLSFKDRPFGASSGCYYETIGSENSL